MDLPPFVAPDARHDSRAARARLAPAAFATQSQKLGSSGEAGAGGYGPGFAGFAVADQSYGLEVGAHRAGVVGDDLEALANPYALAGVELERAVLLGERGEP